jgi:small subunit ribosomal protein S21
LIGLITKLCFCQLSRKNILKNHIQLFTFAVHFLNLKNMIIVPVKEGENIEKSLKKFKRKFEKTGVLKELRSRQAFTKPSVRRREEVKHAVYIQQLQQNEE